MPKEPWPRRRSPKEFLVCYLDQQTTDAGRKVTDLIAELEERKSIEYERFSMFGHTVEDRARYNLHVQRLDSLIENLWSAGRKATLDGLVRGSVIATADYSPQLTNLTIPPRYWPFLEFDIDSASAEGPTFSFRNIRLLLFGDLSKDQQDTINANICWTANKLREVEERRTADDRGGEAQPDRRTDAPLRSTATGASAGPDDRQNGVSLERAAELLDPAIWALAKADASLNGHVDRKGGAQNLRALESLRKSLQSRLLEGEFELQVLHPPGTPDARWTPITRDVLGSISLDSIDFGRSTVEIAPGQPVEARVFRFDCDSTAEGLADQDKSPAAREPVKKIPVYTRVYDAWTALPDEIKHRVTQRGGKKEIARLIHQKMPDVPFPSVEREFRHVRRGA